MTQSSKARTTGALWLVVFIASAVTLALPRGTLVTVAIKIGTLAYVGVTLLLYDLLKPVNRAIAGLAAIAGLVGATMSFFHLELGVEDDLFFGVQCVLVGYLMYRSGLLPRILGVLMIIAGVALLTFVSPLATALSPYNLGAAMIGECATMVWLLVKGIAS